MKLFLLVLGLISLMVLAKAQLPAREITAIRALMHALPGLTNPLGSTHWDPQNPQNACDFKGIKCDGDDTTVIFLLIDEETTGFLPHEIGNFHNITHFELRETLIGGSLPSSLSQWKKLTFFRIWGSQISGSLPDAIAWPKVTHLFLEHSKITGSLPSAWSGHPTLSRISLLENDIHGEIPQAWTAFGPLTFLNLAENKLTGTVPGFLDSPNLDSLILYDNQFYGSLPEKLAPLLNDIDFAANRLTGTIPEWNLMTNEPSSMDLSNNSLTGSIPDFFGPSKYWQRIDFSYNQLTGTIPRSIGDMEGLVELYLENNALTLCPPPRTFLLSPMFRSYCHLEDQSVRAPCACMNAYHEAGCQYNCYA